MEDLDITLVDQIRGTGGRGVEFASIWDSAAARGFSKMEETFALGALVTNLEEAVASILLHLGLEAVERSDRIQAGSTSHTLMMAGIFRGGKEILARTKLVAGSSSITMLLSILCQDPDVAELLIISVE